MSTEVSTESWTTSDWDSPHGQPSEPVVALRVPKGPTYVLSDFRDQNGKRKKWILVGRRETCDLVLSKETVPHAPYKTVNHRHCLLCCTYTGRVMVKHCIGEGKNRTRVNRSRLHDGRTELGPGDVLYVGALQMLAMTQHMLDSDTPPEPKVTARKPGEFFRTAISLIGSRDTTAECFEIPPKTFWRWLKIRFKEND